MFAARRFLPEALRPTVVYVQNNASTISNKSLSSGASSFSFSPTTAPAAGHKLILAIHIVFGSGTGATDLVTSVSDSAGNTWTVDNAAAASGSYANAAICSSNLTSSLTLSSTITVTLGGAVSATASYGYILDEWNFPTSLGVDQIANGLTSYAKSNTATFASSTTDPQDLLISMLTTQSSAGTTITPSNYAKTAGGMYYSQPLSVGKFSASYTWTNSSNAVGLLVAYKS
jgi:hypothetical protein